VLTLLVGVIIRIIGDRSTGAGILITVRRRRR